MSDAQKYEPLVVNIAAWVERAKSDPEAYLERQATEVFLAALAMTKPWCHQVFLKGGILMGVVYGSPRQTGDIDFTTIADPQPGIAEELAAALDANFLRAAAELGYPDLLCRAQSFKYFPKGEEFPKNDGPAIKMGIGYALRGSPQERHLEAGRAPKKLSIDISFKEPVGAIQVIRDATSQEVFQAYSLSDLMAEKIRALLQQEKRNRYRRQDIYDLDMLLAQFPFDSAEKAQLLAVLRDKCEARGIRPAQDSLAEPEIIERAKADWHTLEVEIGEVPDFDECFERVNAFYVSLPW
jgi:hypothetical protein